MTTTISDANPINKVIFSSLICASIMAWPLGLAAEGGGRMLQLEPTAPLNMDEIVESELTRALSQQPAIREANEQESAASEPEVANEGEDEPVTVGPFEPAPNGPGCDVTPASAGVGAEVAETYFGPPPSTVNPSLVGPVELLTAGEIDRQNLTVEVPLYRGQMRDGRNVFYIVTDSTDEGNAADLGIN